MGSPVEHHSMGTGSRRGCACVCVYVYVYVHVYVYVNVYVYVSVCVYVYVRCKKTLLHLIRPKPFMCWRGKMQNMFMGFCQESVGSRTSYRALISTCVQAAPMPVWQEYPSGQINADLLWTALGPGAAPKLTQPISFFFVIGVQ